MEMTTEEIIRDYRQAADKVNQIKVLAELNLCKKQEIAELLMDNGLDVPAYYKGQRKAQESREVKAAELAKEDPPGPVKRGRPPKQDPSPESLPPQELSAAEAAVHAIEDAFADWAKGKADGNLALCEISGILRMYRRMTGKKV